MPTMPQTIPLSVQARMRWHKERLMDPVDERKESDGLEMAHQFNTVLNESMVLRDPSVTLTRDCNDH